MPRPRRVATWSRRSVRRCCGPANICGATFLPKPVPERVVVSLSDQLAYVYRGNTLMAVTTISSGQDDKPTPTGIFSIFDKTPFYRSKKYDNAAMPFAAILRSGGNCAPRGLTSGNEPNSHGCVHLPAPFAKNSTPSPTSERRFISARNQPRGPRRALARPLSPAGLWGRRVPITHSPL